MGLFQTHQSPLSRESIDSTLRKTQIKTRKDNIVDSNLITTRSWIKKKSGKKENMLSVFLSLLLMNSSTISSCSGLSFLSCPSSTSLALLRSNFVGATRTNRFKKSKGLLKRQSYKTMTHTGFCNHTKPILNKTRSSKTSLGNVGFTNTGRESSEEKTEHFIKNVLNLYHSRGIIHADNILDAYLQSNTDDNHRTLRNLQLIFHAEIGIIHQSHDAETQESISPSVVRSLSDAVDCWSHVVRKIGVNDSEARKFAKMLWDFLQDSHISSLIPQWWVDRTEALCKPPETLNRGEETKSRTSAKERWRKISLHGTITSSAVDELLSMIGMENIKDEFINMYQRHQLAEKQNQARFFSFNARFVGKPGTGKRTVARHYASLLRELEILPETSDLIEISGASLSNGGIDELQRILSDAKRAGGGAVLINDANHLVADFRGKQVLHYMLSLTREMKTKYGDFVWILVDDQQEMQKLMDKAPALVSLFPKRFHFNDFTNDELMQIFEQLLVLPPPAEEDSEISQNIVDKWLIDYKGDRWYQQGDLAWHDGKGSCLLPKPLQDPFESFSRITMLDPVGKVWNLQKTHPVWMSNDGRSSIDLPSRFLAGGGNSSQASPSREPFRKHQLVDAEGVEWFFDGDLWKDAYGGSCPHNPSEGFDDDRWLHAQDGSKWQHKLGLIWFQYGTKVQSLNPAADFALKNSSTTSDSMPRPSSFQYEDVRFVRMSIARLGKRRSGASFGNARAVHAYYDAVRSRQATRISAEQEQGRRPNIFLLTKEDLIGPRVTGQSIKRGSAYRKLQSLEGLLPVKRAVDSLIELVAVNAQREEEGKPLLEVVLNRIFLGNPGTGKTTVARIYGQLLAEMGLLSKGDVILKTASDFVGSVLGSSEVMTRDILRASEGCVLVIDEAYGLYSGDGSVAGNNPYSNAVINTIVEQVQAEAGEDRAVLLLGYRTEMERMLRNSNPGLSRRFQLENAFEFPDYSDVELLRVLFSRTRACGLYVTMAVAKRAVASLAKARAKPHFGNAGAVENLLSEAKARLAVGDSILTLQTFGISDDGREEALLDTILEDMVDCSNAKLCLRELRDTVAFARKRGDDPRDHVNFNYLFLGNPGSGKKTIARRMGKMYHALGLLPDDRVTEVSASDLVTGYAGQAGKRTRDVFEGSCGGVLFIDEAYRLDPKRGGGYMTEVVDELVKCVTLDAFQKKVLIILAGYTELMMDMLKVNKGLTSRFPERLVFDNLSAKATARLLVQKLQEKQLEIEGGQARDLERLAIRLVAHSGFANGRDVTHWCTAILKELSRSQADSLRDFPSAAGVHKISDKVTMEQVEAALLRLTDRMSHGVQEVCSASTTQLVDSQPPQDAAYPESLQRPVVPTMKMDIQTEKALDVEIPVEKEEDEVTIDQVVQSPVNLFENMDSQILRKLQNMLDELGLNSEDGVRSLLDSQRGKSTLEYLLKGLVDGGLAKEEAERGIQDWILRLHDLQAQLKEVELQRRQGRRPIWRCAACGRADKPWIACWVAPYIVGYENF